MIPSTTFAIEPADYDGTGAPIIVDISDEVFPIRISVEGDVTITGTGKPQLECRPGTQLTLDNVTIDFSA